MVCPRDIYANERTLVAGIRTSLALFTFGIVIIKIDTTHLMFGNFFGILGIIQMIYSQIYYLIQVKKLKNPDTVFEASYISIQLILSLLMIGFMIWMFVY
jgi:uncharacterized membrane protein YidH (DUF202 family)